MSCAKIPFQNSIVVRIILHPTDSLNSDPGLRFEDFPIGVENSISWNALTSSHPIHGDSCYSKRRNSMENLASAKLVRLLAAEAMTKGVGGFSSFRGGNAKKKRERIPGGDAAAGQ